MKTIKTIKKIVFVLTAIALLIGCIPMVFAEEQISGDWKYEIVQGGITVTGYTGSATKVEIPEKINGKLVRVIGPAAFSGTAITELTIPKSVTKMNPWDDGGGTSALDGMNNLKTLTFADKMTAIPNGAAKRNESITKVIIPDSVSTIGKNAFNGCSALETVSMSNVTTIGQNAFSGCGVLKTVEISENADSDTVEQMKAALKEMTGNDDLQIISVEKEPDDTPVETVTPGDVDGNGQILANDARLALRASAHLENLDEKQFKAADVNGDNQVLANDARQILRYSAKLQNSFDKAA